ANVKDITSFIERNAGIWGARRDVTNRLEFAVQQSVEAALEFGNPGGPIKVEISFDEFVIDAVLSYVGLPLAFPATAPSQDEILETEDGAQRLSGFLIRRYADQIKSSSHNGLNEIRLHFD